jgi:hypothetical protein
MLAQITQRNTDWQCLPEWVQNQDDAYRANAAGRVTANASPNERAPLPGSSRREEAHYSAEYLKTARWRFALDLPLRFELRSSQGNEAQTFSAELDQSLLTSAATIASESVYISAHPWSNTA